MKEILLMALKVAGEELLKQYGTKISSTQKESQSSIVTQADLKSDSIIVKIIRDQCPSHNIISEESGFSNRNSRYTWVIDPLDGTSNFASGIPWFGVIITLLEDEVPVIGGAYLPLNDHLYYAEKGKGCYLNGEPFVMVRSNSLKDSLVSFNVDFTDNESVLNNSLEIYRNLVKAARNIRCTNSLIDFLYVAEGRFGVVINLFTRIWDISALGLIIEEAGGAIRYISGEKIVYKLHEKICEENFAVMAGSEEILRELKVSVL